MHARTLRMSDTVTADDIGETIDDTLSYMHADAHCDCYAGIEGFGADELSYLFNDDDE